MPKISVHRRGFVRKLRGISIETQKQMLLDAGCEEIAIYVDGKEFDVQDFITSLRPGNEACVAVMAALAGDRYVLREVIDQIDERGAVIVELETGRRSDRKKDERNMVFDAIIQIARSKRPRKVDSKRWGGQGGRTPIERTLSREQAETRWFDSRYKTVADAEAHMPGWPASTSYKQFGARGIKPVVGRPKGSKTKKRKARKRKER